jgi:myosin heavy subunit
MQAEQATIAQSQEGDDAADNSTVTKDEEDGAGGEPLWSSLGSLAKKKKKSRVNTGCSTPPVWPPHLQLEVDPTLVILDVDTDAPVVSAGQEHPETEKDSYAGLGMSKRKKLKAKLDKEAKLKEEEDAKRQKEEEKAAEIRRQEEEEAEWIRLEEEEAELRRMEEEEAAAAAAAEAEAELERMKRMEEKRMRLEEEEAELKSMEEEEAAAAAAAEAEKCKKMEEKEANPWTEFPVAPLKKTKKKKSKESELTTKKKKKSRKPEVIRLAEDEENKEIRRERDNVAAAATTTDLSVVDSAGATFGDDDCRLRVEHLSQNFGWQDCEPCQLYIQKIAMKLHSEGLPIEDGFNTIN